MSETLLLTWTISPSREILSQWYKSTSINPNNRYLEYFDSIVYYITQSNFSSIVFCENSNYNFKDLDLINDLCIIYKKKFELLQFTWNHKKTLELWYWFGDWECIDYAIDNSKILNTSANWFKISWRYIVKNINIFLNKNNKRDIIFYKWIWFSPFWGYSAIFKTTNIFYKTWLYNCKKLVDKNKNISLEYVFYFQLRNILFKNWGCNFNDLPILNNWSKKKIAQEYILKFFWLLEYNTIWSILDKILYNFKRYL